MAAMTFEKAFRILQLVPGATIDQLKKNYRTLMLKNHPDRNQNHPDATEATKNLAIANTLIHNLLQPYHELDQGQRQELLNALNGTDTQTLGQILTAYPHNSWIFYRDSIGYQQLAAYLYGKMITRTYSSVCSLFTSCSPIFEVEDNFEEGEINNLSLKKNQ